MSWERVALLLPLYRRWRRWKNFRETGFHKKILTHRGMESKKWSNTFKIGRIWSTMYPYIPTKFWFSEITSDSLLLCSPEEENIQGENKIEEGTCGIITLLSLYEMNVWVASCEGGRVCKCARVGYPWKILHCLRKCDPWAAGEEGKRLTFDFWTKIENFSIILFLHHAATPVKMKTCHPWRVTYV